MRQKVALVVGALTLCAAQAAFAPVVTIKTVEGTGVSVSFNPKEISIDKSVPWQKSKKPEGDAPELEFTAAEGKSMSFELLFDEFEGNDKDVLGKTLSLIKMAEINPMMKRPPMVKVTWGNLPEFQGVIESIGVKYTMFLPDGTPVRATCSVKVKEASRASFAKKADDRDDDD